MSTASAGASLVAAGRRNVHRRLGVAGAVLAAAMTVWGDLVALAAARRDAAARYGPCSGAGRSAAETSTSVSTTNGNAARPGPRRPVAVASRFGNLLE